MTKTKSCRCCHGTGEELNHKAIGAEMRKLRKSRGLIQKWVADKMGLLKSNLCALEKGQRNWNPELIHAYKKAVTST